MALLMKARFTLLLCCVVSCGGKKEKKDQDYLSFCMLFNISSGLEGDLICFQYHAFSFDIRAYSF